MLVAGTSESTLGPTPGPTQGSYGQPGPPQAWASIYRFLPDGSPDPSFGNGGVLVTDFGQKPPSGNMIYPAFVYTTGAVKVSGLAVDSADRPVLSGTSARSVVFCNYFSPYAAYTTRTWVARLTTAGAPDPSFGESGVYANPGAESPDDLALAPNGKVLFTNPTETLCPRPPEGKDEVVDFLGSTGKAARVSFVAPPGDDDKALVKSLAIDSRNRVLVLLHEESQQDGSTAGYVRRLKANGEIDPDFGNNGRFKVPLYQEALGGLALDQSNRILVAATGATGRERSNRVVVARLTTMGKLDRGFGAGGRTSVTFGAEMFPVPPNVIVDARSRIVVAAPIGREEIRDTSRLLGLARFHGR